MPRISRQNINTSFFHVMVQGINKKYIFDKENEIKYYIKLINKLKQKYNVEIIAYCIMNNHAHMLIRTEKVQNLSKFMQSLNTNYAFYYNKKHNRVGYVFRDRFKSQGIYTEKQLYSCIRYIYNNPVKAGMCKKASEYMYSNYKENFYNLGEDKTNYDFIEVDEDKKSIKELIEEYLGNKKLIQVVNNREELKKLICYLKNERKISYRKMQREIGINRETLRQIIAK